MYRIRDKCKNYNHLEICMNSDEIYLRNGKCITNLFNSRLPNCTKINDQHIPNIEKITPGILIFNRFDGDIVIRNETIMLKGKFLIHFSNTSIEIQGKRFHNEQKISNKP